jgi:hypothetical protein
MDAQFGYYLLMLAAVVAGFYVIKKIASCLIRSVVLIIMLAILAFAYYASTSL